MSTPLLGVVFRPQFPPEQLRAVAEAAERLGIDELWLWEDCFAEGGIAAASAALAWTERLQVGIGVLPVPLRNVALAAMEAATVSWLFPGRLHLGVGHGVLGWMEQVGARVESPMTLLREYVIALRSLLAGETVSTDGRYVRLRDVRLDWPPSPPPLLHIGAIRPKTLALAGELADGAILTEEAGENDVRSARDAVDAAGRATVSRGAPRLTVYLRAERDPDAVAEQVNRWADAGADAVVLVPRAGADAEDFVRFVAQQVRPLLPSGN